MPTTYSNPRLAARIEDWPIGTKRTVAVFQVETHPTRGQRATRYTLHPDTGRPNATKKLTYAEKVRIVDGDDLRLFPIYYNGLLKRLQMSHDDADNWKTTDSMHGAFLITAELFGLDPGVLNTLSFSDR
jgi:hypothetical protein